MAIQFGGITTTTKAKSLAIAKEDRVDDYILYNHFNPEEDYYIFLLEGMPKNRALVDKVRAKIDEHGYQSYIIASATTKVFVKEDVKQLTEHMNTFRSKWTDIITYQGVHCSAIMAFGAALYGINRSADIMASDFYDMWMNSPYYYLGHGFIGNFDTFIYPVDSVDQLYPSEDNRHRPFKPDEPTTNWKTRFFFAQLKNMQIERKYPEDMTDFEIVVCKTLEEADSALTKLMNSKLLAWDTETNSLKWFRKSSHIHCFTFCNDGKIGYYIPAKLIFENRGLRRKLCSVMYTCENMVGANIKFDIHFIKHDMPEFDIKRIKHIDDVGQLSHAINSNRTKGLKPMTFFYTPFGGYEHELDVFKKQTKTDNYSLIPINILSKYATIDAIVTFRIYLALRHHIAWVDKNFPNEKPLKDWTMERWYDQVMAPVYPDFIGMEEVGMRMDVEYLQSVRKLLLYRIPIVRDKLCNLWKVPKDFKFNSPDKLGMQIEKMGWPKVAESKKGLYATSDECIQEWKRLNMPGINDLIELRELYSFLGTFIGLESETGNPDDATGWQQFLVFHPEDNSWRVHPNYGVMATETMRCIGTEPNLQNIPAHSKLSDEVKRCITVPTSIQYTIADESGNVYVGGHLDTIEVEGRGRISLADVRETDNIIPNTFEKYKFKYADIFEKDDDENSKKGSWESQRAKIYGLKSINDAVVSKDKSFLDDLKGEEGSEENEPKKFGFGFGIGT